jgi:hypothetical protein
LALPFELAHNLPSRRSSIQERKQQHFGQDKPPLQNFPNPLGGRGPEIGPRTKLCHSALNRKVTCLAQASAAGFELQWIADQLLVTFG